MQLFKKEELKELLNTIKNGKFYFLKDHSNKFQYNPNDALVDLSRIEKGIQLSIIDIDFKTKKNVYENISIHKTESGFFVSLNNEEYLMYDDHNQLGGLKKSTKTISETIQVINVFMSLMDI